MEVAHFTNLGRIRDHNEDTVFGFRLLVDNKPFVIAGVCDGVGGGANGQAASMGVAKEIEKIGEYNRFTSDFTLDDLVRHVMSAISKINSHLYDNYTSQKRVSGTTATILLSDEWTGDVRIIHIGDSRAYAVVNGGVKLITKDDSWVQSQIDKGLMTETEAKVHPKRHKILKAVGASRTVYPKILSPEKHKCWLLTSDGFSDKITDEEVLQMARKQSSLEQIAKNLMERGERDNLSAVMVWL